MLMTILLLGRVKKRSSHYVWKMSMNEWPEITPEAVVYMDAAESCCTTLVLNQGKLSCECLRVQTFRAPMEVPQISPDTFSAAWPSIILTTWHGLFSLQGEKTPSGLPGAILGCDKHFLGQTEISDFHKLKDSVCSPHPWETLIIAEGMTGTLWTTATLCCPWCCLPPEQMASEPVRRSSPGTEGETHFAIPFGASCSEHLQDCRSLHGQAVLEQCLVKI